MDVNSFLYKLITILLGAIMMSFAWPLRGQFGHEWGAAITGGMGASLVSLLIPWKTWRQVFAQAAFFGIFGFVIGGENIAYGALIDDILLQPTLAAAMPQLMLVLFIGATWGCISTTYLGYGVSEVAMSLWDYAIVMIVGGALVIIGDLSGNTTVQIIMISLAVIFLQGYNLIFKRSQIVLRLGIAGLIGFGLGFFLAVVILYLGNKGMLGGPPNWWTLRDQMWGFAGGLGIMLATYPIVAKGWTPVRISPAWFQKFGLIVFVPGVCGFNTWDVYNKWFVSTPPAPDPHLAAVILGIGIVLLVIAFLICLFVNGQIFTSSGLNPLLLGFFLFFALYLRFFAIAKSIVYSGWGVWETGFTLFLFDCALLFLIMPFILLGPENP